MKYIILLLALVFSTTTFARQYFQCANTDRELSDVMVINLTAEDKGTIFISSGMQNPEDERFVAKLELEKAENQIHYYQIRESHREGVVAIPSPSIGKSMDSVLVEFSFGSYQSTFSCFAKIYNE